MKIPKIQTASAAAIIIAILLGISIVSNSSYGDTDLVPIEIELPKYVFEGTKQDIVVENLEKLPDKPRPPFLAPAGTTNVALGKSVKSSDKFIIIGDIDYVTDGNKDTTDGNPVQLAPGVQNVTIDLGQMCDIYAVVIWHLHNQEHIFFDVVVQTSKDDFFVENVQTLFNNDIDNSAGQGLGEDKHYIETNKGQLIDAKGVTGRYVRLYSNGYALGSSNYYCEVEVYGKPVE
ncbi:hypothetical protein ACFLZ8_00155 [Planctomycetota bacterium]